MNQQQQLKEKHHQQKKPHLRQNQQQSQSPPRKLHLWVGFWVVQAFLGEKKIRFDRRIGSSRRQLSWSRRFSISTKKQNLAEISWKVSEIIPKSDRSIISRLSVLRDAFRIFDSDGRGCIQLEMVKEILTLLGHEVNDDELDEVMEEFDEDENGTIEFSEFIKLAEEFVEPEQEYNEAKRDLREIFMMYDKDQRGFIPVADFKALLKEVESELPDAEAEQIVKELDTDGSGTIEFDGEILSNDRNILNSNQFLLAEFIDAMLGEDEEANKVRQ